VFTPLFHKRIGTDAFNRQAVKSFVSVLRDYPTQVIGIQVVNEARPQEVYSEFDLTTLVNEAKQGNNFDVWWSTWELNLDWSYINTQKNTGCTIIDGHMKRDANWFNKIAVRVDEMWSRSNNKLCALTEEHRVGFKSGHHDPTVGEFTIAGQQAWSRREKLLVFNALHNEACFHMQDRSMWNGLDNVERTTFNTIIENMSSPPPPPPPPPDDDEEEIRENIRVHGDFGTNAMVAIRDRGSKNATPEQIRVWAGYANAHATEVINLANELEELD
jgi:hypothetical protein